jgi:polyisoprenoid-binding protein YceI
MTVTTTLSQLEGLVPGTWTIDPSHSDVTFTVRHLMSKVRGQFTNFEGAVVITEDPTNSTATATIDLSSVDTRNADRDTHLRSSDFFGVDEHGAMTFSATGVRFEGDDIIATGDLTIRGVTKPVELAVEFLGVANDPWGNLRAGFEATTSISRKEWGIAFNIPVQGDKLMIGDTVNIAISVETIHQG